MSNAHDSKLESVFDAGCLSEKKTALLVVVSNHVQKMKRKEEVSSIQFSEAILINKKHSTKTNFHRKEIIIYPQHDDSKRC